MSRMECLREQEIVEAVSRGHYSEELRSHLGECAVCADIVEIAATLREDFEESLVRARVPSAGLVWWRSELRARQEAMRVASRPITLVQTFGGACAAGVAFALLSRAWPWLKTTLALIDISSLSFLQWSLIIAAILAAVIAPVAMYFVLSDE